MLSDKKARHFHAGKLRKTIGDTVYVSVAESGDRLYVARDGTFTSASRGWSLVRGSLEKDGYRRISVNGRRAVAARVVYEVFVARIPDGMEIDHINTVRNDNRVENLRVVTHRDNLLNPLTRPRRRAACAKNAILSVKAQGRAKILASMKLGWDAHRKPVRVTVNGVASDYRTANEAAKALGVATETLRNLIRGSVRRHWGKLRGVSAAYVTEGGR